MKQLTLITALLIVSSQIIAQDKSPMSVKQFYTEMGGPGILFSANFDTRFNPEKHIGFGMRVGIGFTIKDEGSYDPNGNYQDGILTVPTLPIGFNYLFGKETSPHTFEVGAGTTFLFQKVQMLNYESHQKEGNFMGFFSFMYRRQPINGGFTWRIGFTPLINTAGDIVPFAAGGIGYSF